MISWIFLTVSVGLSATSTQAVVVPQSTEKCLDLDFLQAAIENVAEHWETWTKTSLAASWPGSIAPEDCSVQDLAQCQIFSHLREGVSGTPGCGEYFYWRTRDDGPDVLDSVRLYYTTESEARARDVAALLEDALSPPPNALRIQENAVGDKVAGGLHWEVREKGRVAEVTVVEWIVEPQGDFWLVRFGFRRDTLNE